MILYKYTSCEAGRSIVRGNSIGFAYPADFNDPFELTGYPVEGGSNPISQLLGTIRSEAKRGVWTRNSAILCLTRSQLNPLMWAHYGDSHRGFVIGFDATTAGFASTERNLLPAQFGSVRYTQHRPNHDLVSSALMQVGREFSYRTDLHEKLERLFLYKPLCWAYEEEVRVVKCVNGIEASHELPSGTFLVLDNAGRRLCVINLPEDSIREVYLGARNPIVAGRELDEFSAQLHRFNPRAQLFRCRVRENEWSIESSLV